MAEVGDEAPWPWTLTRRRLLMGTGFVAATSVAGRLQRARGAASPAGVDFGGVEVIPRSEWAGRLEPTGPIPQEAEVLFLLVHHSVDPGNGYAPEDVAGVLRDFYRSHTAKGWPDVAYNFLVDRFGRVWEGRAGSLEEPVAGDATGGNQGSDQLCCFIGNHQQGDPSPEAFAAMAALLGALGRRYAIPLGREATVVFTSRGSNRHPEGSQVTTATIAPHRAMSLTQCPGDRLMARLDALRSLAAGEFVAAPPAAQPSSAGGAAATGPTAPSPPTTGTTPATTLGQPRPLDGQVAPPAAEPPASPAAGALPPRRRTRRRNDDLGPAAPAAGGAALVAAGAGLVATWSRRRRSSAPGEGDADDRHAGQYPVHDERGEGARSDQAE